MNDITFYTPKDIPKNILAFDSEPKQLAVGKTGKNGCLNIVLKTTSNGKTIISEQYSQTPLHIQRALYCEKELSNMAYLYIISASGGILQGDRYRIDITLDENSTAHITTQGATRVYSMNSNSAMQALNITLKAGAYLEFVPDQIIPYNSSRFYQNANITIDDEATLVYSETIAPGRTAMGESFQYDVCHLKTCAKNQAGKTRFIDIANMDTRLQNIQAFGLIGEYQIMGSVYVLSAKQNILSMYKQINAIIAQNDKVYGGASLMRDDTGILVRMLGQETEEIKDTIYDIVKLVRKTCTGASFSSIRKN